MVLKAMTFRIVSKGLAGLACICVLAGLFALVPHDARAGALGDLAKASKTARRGLFGRIEMKSGSLKALPKWSSVLTKMKRQKAALKACTQARPGCPPGAAKSWKAGIEKARKLKGFKQLVAVNRYFNRWPYKLDRNNYKIRDYWATPKEFLRKSGDCEDYSISKFYALMELGYANKDLRVVVIINKVSGIGHAVLAVKRGNKHVILDNVSSLILDSNRLSHYIPQYSINETTRWAHIGKM